MASRQLSAQSSLSHSGTSAAPWWRRKSVRQQTTLWLSTLLLIIGAFFMLLPVFWMLSASLKDEGDVFLVPIQWLPDPFRWSNYPEALTFQPFWSYFRNSVIVTGLSVVGAVLSASLVAYAFARLRAPGKNVLFAILLSTLMLPGEVTLVPIYLLFRNLGWLDTYRPLIVPSWFGGSAFYIFLLRQFFLTLPTELDDAAKIDGANLFSIYWRILLPLTKPALASVAIFSFFSQWNNFQAALIYLNTMEKYTLPIGLRLYLSSFGQTHWNYLMAATLVSVVPPILIFFTSQRYFVEGAALTGVKG
ncbi:MAG: carbohydrate ABC transporter permease [Caldilineaceae bacterium]|nr:carbohydrate ABC transporter permease [Caldilineaceae bacterium]